MWSVRSDVALTMLSSTCSCCVYTHLKVTGLAAVCRFPLILSLFCCQVFLFPFSVISPFPLLLLLFLNDCVLVSVEVAPAPPALCNIFMPHMNSVKEKTYFRLM